MSPETGRPSSARRLPKEHLLTLAILLYALMIGTYFVLRYGGQWMETDSAGMIYYIEQMRRAGGLQSPERVYDHGFGYQALSLSVMAATGLSSQTLQTVVFPLLAVLGVGLAAFALYSQAARSRLVAALATLLLLLQPDLLFATMRGSHEKLDWPLMIVAVLLFYRSINQPVRTAWIYIGLCYMVVFAFATVNVFFASSFLIAIIASLVLGRAVSVFQRRRTSRSGSDLERLIYVGLSCGLLIFVIMFYIYPPAAGYLRIVQHATDRVGELLLGFERTGQPYASIGTAWLSQAVYLGLTAYTWLLIALSFVAWLYRGKQILWDVVDFHLARSLDWLLYAGFAIQVALGIAIDLSGALSANMQLRAFPGFVIWAALLLAHAIWQVFGSLWVSGWKRRLSLGLAGLAVACFAIAAVFKATNEPLVGNWWLFYTTSEDNALYWTNQHVGDAGIWTGVDSRVAAGFTAKHALNAEGSVRFSSFAISPYDRYMLSSSGERFRSLRMGIAVHSSWVWNHVYDNGEAFIAHKRPETPFQR